MQCLRCGLVEKAHEACLAANQPWRCASLDGGAFWTDGVGERVGNPFRLLWKWCHWQNCDSFREYEVWTVWLASAMLRVCLFSSLPRPPLSVGCRSCIVGYAVRARHFRCVWGKRVGPATLTSRDDVVGCAVGTPLLCQGCEAHSVARHAEVAAVAANEVCINPRTRPRTCLHGNARIVFLLHRHLPSSRPNIFADVFNDEDATNLMTALAHEALPLSSLSLPQAFDLLDA